MDNRYLEYEKMIRDLTHVHLAEIPFSDGQSLGYRKTRMTPKQNKARAKNKQAKKSRIKNRRKK
jgi:hypothetical protein